MQVERRPHPAGGITRNLSFPAKAKKAPGQASLISTALCAMCGPDGPHHIWQRLICRRVTFFRCSGLLRGQKNAVCLEISVEVSEFLLPQCYPEAFFRFLQFL